MNLKVMKGRHLTMAKEHTKQTDKGLQLHCSSSMLAFQINSIAALFISFHFN